MTLAWVTFGSRPNPQIPCDYERLFGTFEYVGELQTHEIELLRRSVAIVTPGQPSGLNREIALKVLGQLQDVTHDRDRLAVELADCISRQPSNQAH